MTPCRYNEKDPGRRSVCRRRRGRVFPGWPQSDLSVMMVMVIVMVMVTGSLISASGLLERLIKKLVDLPHLAHRRADIAGDRR